MAVTQRGVRKRNVSKSSEPSEKVDSKSIERKNDGHDPKFGSLGIKREHQVLSRFVLLAGMFVVVVVTQLKKANKETDIVMAPQSEILSLRGLEVLCDEKYKAEVNKFHGCVPQKCGRLIMDNIVTNSEVAILTSIAKKGMKFGRSSGGASILDLHSGALSKDDRFINIYSLPETSNLWSPEEFQTYVSAKNKIKSAISMHFGVSAGSLYLASPTFFSEITSKEAKTIHDEYWHPHVDKETYESFHFTSLLYLTDYGVDFDGGRFIFVDKDGTNRTIEPRKGRVSMFTSGPENLHFVEKVRSGVRYAVTIAFTCDPSKAIADPQTKAK